MSLRRRALVLLGVMLLGPWAGAAPPRRRVVLDVQGPNAVLLRKTLHRALSRLGFEVVFSPAGGLAGRPGLRRVRQIARLRGANALLMARVERGKSRRVVVSVFGTGHWRRPIGIRWPANALGGLRRVPPSRLAALAKVLGAMHQPTRLPTEKPPTPEVPPPAVAEPSTETATPEDSDEVEGAEATTDPLAVTEESELSGGVDEEEETPAVEALEVTVGTRGFSRRLQLTIPPGQAPTQYFLPLGPAVLVAADWFPGAHFGSSPWAHLGITGGIESGFALRSTLGANVYPTDALAAHIGVKGRLPLGTVVLQASASYAVRSFRFLPSLGTLQDAPLPNVSYRGPRFGLEGRVALGERFSLRVGAGYQLLLTAGALSSAPYFPDLSAYALDANVSGVVSLIPGWSLKAGLDFNRYFLRMTQLANGAPFDGRGLDQSFGVSLALLFVFT